MSVLFASMAYAYPLLCILLPTSLYQMILHRQQKHAGNFDKKEILWRYIFVLYLFVVTRVVGFGSIWDIGRYDTIIRPNEIAWIPFQFGGMITHILNVILFMPLGFLLPYIWGDCRKLSVAVLTGVLLSVSIELSQLLNRRLTDIDDVITNTLGTMIGYGAWWLLMKRIKLKPKEMNTFPDNPWAYMVLTVLGTFFLFTWRLVHVVRRLFI